MLSEAREAYLRNYGKDWQGLGRITGVDKDTFDKWLDSSDRKVKAFGEHSIVKSHMVERGETAFDSALKGYFAYADNDDLAAQAVTQSFLKSADKGITKI